ncbi:hypothetical protein [Novosphingobium huizhouense]|uniref:hypothetical protein n=1 Tax=Novosphingobium huizhouense TaxID=2866625 RepID=UPI001CD8E18D|nr:hypothetical protein [Novosphingobium huizhouense]
MDRPAERRDETTVRYRITRALPPQPVPVVGSVPALAGVAPVPPQAGHNNAGLVPSYGGTSNYGAGGNVTQPGLGAGVAGVQSVDAQQNDLIKKLIARVKALEDRVDKLTHH